MSSTESPISINLKTAAGTQITLRADTADQFADMIAQGIHTITDAVTEVELAVKGTTGNKPMSVADIASSFNSNISTTQSSGGEETVEDKYGNTWVYNKPGAPSCERGVMVLKYGKAQATGKPYKAFYDPAAGPNWSGPKIPAELRTKPIFA